MNSSHCARQHNDSIFSQSHGFPLFSRSVTEEEREAKYVRMLTSSLLGVKRLLFLLLQDDRRALEQRLAHLVNSGKFWKYSKHKTPQVMALNRSRTALLTTDVGMRMHVIHELIHLILEHNALNFHSTKISY